VLELQLAETRGDQLRALSQLYRALGGGWQPEPGVTQPGSTHRHHRAPPALTSCRATVSSERWARSFP
jgi:hypothetical protein